MRHTSVLAVLIVTILAPGVRAEEDPYAKHPLGRGFGYIGGFFVTNIETQLSVFSQNNPLGGRVNFGDDLGLTDSLSVPRVTVGWRFGKNHLLSFGWYNLEREASTTLSRKLKIFDEEYTIGTTVDSFFRTEVYKLGYTWMFHQDRKVSLGLGAGLYVSDLAAGLSVAGSFAENQGNGDLTAPLPVLGGRLTYRVTPRLSVMATADWFFVSYDKYKGLLSDVIIFANHRTFKHVGFGAGLNLQSLGVDIDDEDFLWEIQDRFVGYLVVVTFHF